MIRMVLRVLEERRTTRMSILGWVWICGAVEHTGLGGRVRVAAFQER
jgi:hypothetical protein